MSPPASGSESTAYAVGRNRRHRVQRNRSGSASSSFIDPERKPERVDLDALETGVADHVEVLGRRLDQVAVDLDPGPSPRSRTRRSRHAVAGLASAARRAASARSTRASRAGVISMP